MDFVIARLLGTNWRAGLIGRLLVTSWRKGVGEGSRLWLVVGGVALLLGLSRREKESKVVYREVLRPGETLLLTAQQADAVLLDG